jgi:hypothetical protein
MMTPEAKNIARETRAERILEGEHVAGVPLQAWHVGETPCAWVTGETPDVDILTVGGVPRLAIRRVADGWAVNTAGRATVRWDGGRGAMVLHAGESILAGVFETYFRAKVQAEKMTVCR